MTGAFWVVLGGANLFFGNETSGMPPAAASSQNINSSERSLVNNKGILDPAQMNMSIPGTY